QWAVSFEIWEKSKKQKHLASNDNINNMKTPRYDTVTAMPSKVETGSLIPKDDSIPKDDLPVDPSPNVPAATADPASQPDEGQIVTDSITLKASLLVDPSSDAPAATANPAGQSEDGSM
ncbi:hypothetical protein FQN50_009074, partial [Emmonsiellopsis sp. PD_5]